MTRSFALGLLPAAFLATTVLSPAVLAQPASVAIEGTITPLKFETVASRNPAFDRAGFLYPADNALAGQVNPNAGDVRLDGVIIDGVTYGPAQLQLATAAAIILNDAVDATRGGGNLTAGYGLGADRDPWVGEGPGSTTPTADSLRAAQANFNLSSIVPVRENVGTVIYELSFDNPTDTLLLWERGNSGDVLVTALDDAGNPLDSFLVLDGANDGTAASTYAKTGVVVTTYVQDGFLNQGQELSSVGLRLAEPARHFRFTAYQEAEGAGAVRYNGPDLKVLALAAR